MGLKLRLNLFHQVSSDAVLEAYAAFYKERGQRLIDHGEDYWAFRLHQQQGPWTTLCLDGGWEWEVRRQAQLDVSRRLGCAGFLVFVFDGDYWGYEFFSDGEALDQFVQREPEGEPGWFPGKALLGSAQLLADRLDLDVADVAPYLVQDPSMSRAAFALDADDLEAHRRFYRDTEELDVRVRPGDEFTRFAECAVLDFLRMLGVQVELRSGYVKVSAPQHRRFWIEGQNTHRAWRALTGKRRECPP